MGDADRVRDGFARLAAERGPAVRRQRAATIPLSAAAFVAAAVLVPLFLQGSGGSAGPDRIIPPHRIVHSPPDPWTINACPATLTHEFAAALPSRIATIRMCDLPETQGGSGTRSPLDALIIQLSGLVADLESVPAADPARCAASEPVATGAVMVVTDRTRRRDACPCGGLLRHRSRRAKDRCGGHARGRAPTPGHPTSYDARPLVRRIAGCVLFGDPDGSPVRPRHRAGHRRVDLPGDWCRPVPHGG